MKLIVRGADYAMTDSITDCCPRAAPPLRDSDRCGPDDKQCCTGPLCGERVEKKVSACFGWSGPESCVQLPASDPKDIPHWWMKTAFYFFDPPQTGKSV